MTLRELRAQVAANIGGDAHHISKYYIDRWLNEAYKNMSHRISFKEKSITLTGITDQEITFSTTSSAATYPLLNRGHQIRRVEFTNGSNIIRLDYITLDELDRFRGSSAVDTSTPWAYYLWGNVLGLYPGPSSSSTLKIKYVEDSPSDLPASGELTDIPPFMQPMLVQYATSMAYLKLQNVNMYREYRGIYDAGVETAAMEMSMDNRDLPTGVHDVMGYTDESLWDY